MSSTRTTTLGGYLAERIAQAGITDFFGVPGDYNLVLLDELLKQPGLRMVGCCNELNAGYAADGYARVRRFSVVDLREFFGDAGTAQAAAAHHRRGPRCRRWTSPRKVTQSTAHAVSPLADSGLRRGSDGRSSSIRAVHPT